MGSEPHNDEKIIKYNVIKGIEFDTKLIDELKQNYGLPIEYLASRAKQTLVNVKLKLYDNISERRTTIFCFNSSMSFVSNSMPLIICNL